MSDLVQLTGLWLKESKNGNRYMTGSVGGAWVKILPNTKKSNEKQPDYYLCLEAKEYEKKAEGAPAQNFKNQTASTFQPELNESDIPF